ncbi:MAG: exosome complex protein Rrp42 [Candidatus Bilamarchaeaceae archaeon]
MGEETKDIVMKHMRKRVMESILAKGTRIDGRNFEDIRIVEIQKGAIATAEGSSFVKLGHTQVLVATKFDVVTPFPDRPTEGALIVNSEFLPLASASFEPGPPDENSIEAARTVDRAVRSSEALDLNSFYIEEGKVLGLFIDIYVMNHAGNYTDAATLAATAALMNTRIPKVENGKIIRGEYNGGLKLRSLPVSTTFAKIGKYWLVDPTKDEENVMETRITIATTEEHVCAIQKGQGWLTNEELFNNIDIAFKKGSELRKILLSD